jgi:hypothetical protein
LGWRNDGRIASRHRAGNGQRGRPATQGTNMKTYPFFCEINGVLAAAKLPLVMDPPKP